MKRRDFVKWTAGAAAVGVAGSQFPKPALAQKRIEWKLQSTWAKNSPLLSTGPDLVADYINKASAGRLVVKVFAAGEIAPPLQTIDAVADGGIEMGHGYPAYWVGKLNAVNFFAPLPFGLTTQEQNAWFKFGGGDALADKVYSQLGVKFFRSGNTSVQAAGWFNKELNTLADFKGLKVRSGGLGARVLREVGATPVQMPLGEVPQSLQSGAIDGADFVGPMNDMAFGLHKLAKYYYWPGWMEPCGVLDCFVNLKAYQALPDDLKEIVKGANEYANGVVVDEFVAKNAQAIKTMIEEHKVQVKMLSDETLVALGKAANGVINAAASQDALSREVFDSILKFRETVLPYTNISELAFMKARTLNFPYGKA